MLDLRALTTITDYFVLCTAPSERQLRAVVKALDDELARVEPANPRIEGSPETGWVVMDYGYVIVHVFSPEQRQFYRLDRLWKQAQPVVVVQ
ncbi:MAG: ribosome silencing factor [Herpetosiphon sp.]